MATSGADVLAALKDMTDPAHLEAINSALNSLGDRDSAHIAQEVTAVISRLEAVRYRALSRLSVLRGGVRSVVQEVAMTLSLVDGYAGSLVATGSALTTRLPRTLSLMDRGKVTGFNAQKVAEATAWLSDEDSLIADAALESRLPEKNSEQTRKAATYAALNADRAGSAKRTAERRGGRRLSVAQGEAGVASIEVIDGPVEKVTAAYERINREARALKTRGDVRTMRDRECRRPGCARAAHACELDHSIPWQHQGETNVADLVTYCTRDHHLKDEPGWIYHLDPNGTLTITTPTGQTYRSTPPPLHDPRPEPPPF